MKKILLTLIIPTLLFSSCRSLHSTTYIKANDEFILGSNEHKKFSVKLKNTSENTVELWQIPVSGGGHSRMELKPNKKIILNITKNTALRIENKDKKQAIIQLVVRGDTGLSMNYKN